MKARIFGTVVLSLAMSAIPGCKKDSNPAGPSTPKTPAPTLTMISPNSGPTSGGTTVTITGTGFASGAKVTFGGTAAAETVISSATSITAETPQRSAGAVDVVVTNPDGQSARLTNGFTYVFNVNGSWEGRTVLGAKFIFSVSNMAITYMILSEIPGKGGTVFGWTMTCPINNNAFTYTFATDHPYMSGWIKGTFSSETSVSGTMEITFKTGSKGTHNCEWSATKK